MFFNLDGQLNISCMLLYPLAKFLNLVNVWLGDKVEWNDPVFVLRDETVPFFVWLRKDRMDLFSVWSRDIKSGIGYLTGRVHVPVSSHA